MGVLALGAEFKNAHSFCRVGSRQLLMRRLGSSGPLEGISLRPPLAASLAWWALSRPQVQTTESPTHIIGTGPQAWNPWWPGLWSVY